MTFPAIGTATAIPRQAQFQGVINVPLFEPPYSLVEIPQVSAGATLSPHCWWPLLSARAGASAYAQGFIALLCTLSQYTKFQYNPAIVTDTWGNQIGGMNWFGNTLLVPDNFSNQFAKVAIGFAPLGANITYNNFPKIINFQATSTLLASVSNIFSTGDSFPSIAWIGAETGTQYKLYSTSIYGNYAPIPGQPPLFDGPVGLQSDLFNLADLGPSIYYCQPDFNPVTAANWFFFSQNGAGNFITGRYVGVAPMLTAAAGGVPVANSKIQTAMYKITFDDPFLNANMTPANFNPSGGVGWAGNFSKGHIWIGNVIDNQLNQNNMIVILNNDCTRYWRVKFLPRTTNAANALAQPQWNVKIDPFGKFYFKTQGGAGAQNVLRRILFNSGAFNFSFQFPTANLQFNGLPCFQPCDPFAAQIGPN